MDLDKMRERWVERSNTPLPLVINDTNVFDLIQSRSKTALERLILIEIACAILSLVFLSAPYIHGMVFPRLPYPFFLKYGYFVLCIFVFLWQLYKIQLLKKIDVRKDSLLKCSKYIVQYKMNIKREVLVGFILFFIFLYSFAVTYIDLLPTERLQLYFLIFNIVLFMMVCFLLFLFYKYFYLKQIKELTGAIIEIRELEKDINKEIGISKTENI